MPLHGAGGRPSKESEEYKDEILDQVHTKQWKQQEIVTWLADNKDLKINARTLQRRLKEWRSHQQDRTEDSEQLRNRIQYLFWLKAEGFQVTPRGLIRIRKELGFKRLEQSQEKREHMDEVVRRLIEQKLGKNVIQSYGRGQLVEHFRKLGHPVARDRLFAQYRTILPDAVDRRLRDVQRKRGEYVGPGPNLVWSVDGHDKLSEYGIEIYGGIDDHARYIPWLTVDVTNRTAISVLRGFLDCISVLGQQPRFVRSERGGETVLMAQAHLTLQQAYDPEMAFQERYMYGTSTSNQRIESWSAQLTKCLLEKWISFFGTLRGTGKYSKDVLADRVAILAIYFPTIRTEVTHFVDNWNTHTIRKQPHRPKSVQGKPYTLFYHPADGIRNYGLGLHEPTLTQLRRDVGDWDPDEYLPSFTLGWCNAFLRHRGFDPYSPPAIPPHECQSPWLDHYLALRTAVSNYEIEGHEPRLGLVPRPEGALQWAGPDPRPLEGVRELDFQGDGADEGFANWRQEVGNIL
ncbi:hypothetical protein HO173_003263 [Letharia columbiana]|uniref:Integrase core domain-containing protein n=1 Tax=Letharia columbiana TaxID=112416 RepID=A0A8H6G1N6_9LECA|nr:uncharacterized protein HO173_003263 [Letharia columbiana]KAF6238756.1 hypothetical protein HO173_003263 [Letharia columbiana]